MQYLIIGDGGREHAVAWKLSQSEDVKKIYYTGDNAGMDSIEKCVKTNLNTKEEYAQFAKANNIDCVIPGSEAHLVDGVVDECQKYAIHAFGPHKAAAMLEGSKSLAKKFMLKYGVCTAAHIETSSVEEAISYLQTCAYPVVVKADGLAGGKGVVICQNKQEAQDAVTNMLVHNAFGTAGHTLVIEEYLDGFEASIISFYDGKTIVPCLSAKDHKKINEGETGLNTGGMGVIVPNVLFTKKLEDNFIQTILEPTLKGLQDEKLNFAGVIFFGLMIVNEKCYLLEYNMRFGDPEVQTLMPLLESNLSHIIQNAIQGSLNSNMLQWKKQSACCVIAASGGYPQKYEVGKQITGIENMQSHTAVTFCAAVSQDNDTYVTKGGRVLGLVGLGDNLDIARQNAYEGLQNITFEGMYYRKDIGKI